MRCAFKYRWYPTSEQADLLARTFGCVRCVWNRALAQRTDAGRERRQGALPAFQVEAPVEGVREVHSVDQTVLPLRVDPGGSVAAAA